MPMPDGKWSDDGFLDALRRAGDPPADDAVRRMKEEGGDEAVNASFKMLRANDSPLPAEAPQALKDFMVSTGGLPPGLSVDRLQRGEDAFVRNALPSVVVLLASSLPRGYAAPCLCEILSISGDLKQHPYRRLMGVVQLLIDISDADAFNPGGRAIVTAQKLRLLHAGIREIAKTCRPDYRQEFGVPVNHEDMLATIMAFSFLVVDGIGRLGLKMAPGEGEDLYYVWRMFALLMGIHPEGRPHDESFIPGSLAEAALFYASYVRRHNTMPDRNRYGVVLTHSNLKMMEKLMPRLPRLLGLGCAPRVFMTELLTPVELARVGFTPLKGHRMRKAFLDGTLWLAQLAGERIPVVAWLARLILQGMVDVDRGGEVSFAVPFKRRDLLGQAFR
jgi:hypothetical protein